MSRVDISARGLRQLRRMASRRARTADEADDLVQDTLVAALEASRDCDGAQFFAWASAVLKRRALFVARTAGRRRRRDTNYAIEAGFAVEAGFAIEAGLAIAVGEAQSASGSASEPASHLSLPQRFIDSLPPAVRTIALLVNAGLGRAEIASVLGISDLALRQRISFMRKAWKLSGADHDISEPPRRARPPCGLLRRYLKTTLVKLPAARVAIVDPDGHSIFLKVAHKSEARGN